MIEQRLLELISVKISTFVESQSFQKSRLKKMHSIFGTPCIFGAFSRIIFGLRNIIRDVVDEPC